MLYWGRIIMIALVMMMMVSKEEEEEEEEGDKDSQTRQTKEFEGREKENRREKRRYILHLLVVFFALFCLVTHSSFPSLWIFSYHILYSHVPSSCSCFWSALLSVYPSIFLSMSFRQQGIHMHLFLSVCLESCVPWSWTMDRKSLWLNLLETREEQIFSDLLDAQDLNHDYSQIKVQEMSSSGHRK